MWQRHWNLTRDPFDPRHAAFAATVTHGEAVARLVRTIETSGRSAGLIAAAGMGKSTVLTRAIEATRGPARRVARATSPVDGAELFASLARGLGGKVAAGTGRVSAWMALREAIRLCRFQKLHVVLAVDACESLDAATDRADLDRLDHLDLEGGAALTLLRVGRPRAAPEADPAPAGWGLPIRLARLTRGEAAEYVAAKLRAAGRAEPTFTPRALSRLHAESGGIPLGLDRLAGLSLMISAVRGLEVIPPEVVEGAGQELAVDRPVAADG